MTGGKQADGRGLHIPFTLCFFLPTLTSIAFVQKLHFPMHLQYRVRDSFKKYDSYWCPLMRVGLLFSVLLCQGKRESTYLSRDLVCQVRWMWLLLPFKVGSCSLPTWYTNWWETSENRWQQHWIVVLLPRRSPSRRLWRLRSKWYTYLHFFFPVLEVPQLIPCQQWKVHFQNQLQALILFLSQAEERSSATLIQHEGKMTFYITRP